MRARLSFLLISLIALGGCASSGITTPRPEITVPQNFVFAPSAGPNDTSQSENLLPLGNPAFQALLARAQNAPDLLIALARVESARAVARRASAERQPRIDASGSVGVQRTNPNQFGNAAFAENIDTTQFSVGANISASWDADLFGRLRASERAAGYRLDAFGFDAEAVRIALVAEVAAAISDWQSVNAQQRQLAANISAAEARARLIGSRVRAGLNPGLDAMRAEAIVEALRVQLAPLEGTKAEIVARLVALTAAPGEAILADLKRADSEWSVSDAPTTVPSTLIAARPDIQAAAARLAASDADVAATAARRFPNLSLSSALGFLAFSLGGLFDTDAITGQLGAAIAGPLLDFGRIGAEIDQSKAQSRIAFEDLRKATFIAIGQAEDAFGRMEATDREAALLEAQARREEDVAKVSASRYRAGLETLVAVLDADRIAYQTRQQQVAAKGRAQRARINLWQSLGGNGAAKLIEFPSSDAKTSTPDKQ
jgi:outer membrane protein, multidrug efflux system